MQDLFAKVQAVNTDLVFSPLAPHAHFSRFQDGPGFAVFPRGLQGNITLGVSVKHPEEVVVGAGHDDTARQRGNREQLSTVEKGSNTSLWCLSRANTATLWPAYGTIHLIKNKQIPKQVL